MSESQNANPIAAILSLVILGGLVWYFWGGGIEADTARGVRGIHEQVARDAVDHYNIAKRSGTAIDACVHAGLVAAAYLQAKDETNYRSWKRTEEADCKAAGVPR